MEKCQLHHFSDTSLLAYGSVNVEGRIHCALLLGKSKLAPIRQMTIPRILEVVPSHLYAIVHS